MPCPCDCFKDLILFQKRYHFPITWQFFNPKTDKSQIFATKSKAGNRHQSLDHAAGSLAEEKGD